MCNTSLLLYMRYAAVLQVWKFHYASCMYVCMNVCSLCINAESEGKRMCETSNKYD